MVQNSWGCFVKVKNSRENYLLLKDLSIPGNNFWGRCIAGSPNRFFLFRWNYLEKKNLSGLRMNHHGLLKLLQAGLRNFLPEPWD